MIQKFKLNFINKFFILLLILVTAASVSCSKKDSEEKKTVSGDEKIAQKPDESMKNFSVDSITRGALVFQERCAECHGPQAQGHPGWTPTQAKSKKDSKAIIVAPPLDGTGVAHLRKKSQLVKVIKKGITRNGKPVMPAADGKLSKQEIEDAITWFQALWPPKVYEAWNGKNKSTLSSKK